MGMFKKLKKCCYAKYETNSVAKQKTDWTQKLASCLRMVAWEETSGGCYIVTNNRVLLLHA